MKQENCHKAKKKRNQSILLFGVIFLCAMLRSEERRVGKEC